MITLSNSFSTYPNYCSRSGPEYGPGFLVLVIRYFATKHGPVEPPDHQAYYVYPESTPPPKKKKIEIQRG